MAEKKIHENISPSSWNDEKSGLETKRIPTTLDKIKINHWVALNLLTITLLVLNIDSILLINALVWHMNQLRHSFVYTVSTQRSIRFDKKRKHLDLQQYVKKLPFIRDNLRFVMYL